jgi:hypothetical protein
MYTLRYKKYVRYINVGPSVLMRIPVCRSDKFAHDYENWRFSSFSVMN